MQIDSGYHFHSSSKSEEGWNDKTKVLHFISIINCFKLSLLPICNLRAFFNNLMEKKHEGVAF